MGFELIAEGLEDPIGITHAGDGSDRLFVTEGLGTIRVLENGLLLPEPFLDITARVNQEGEGALWDIAFHPDFADNGRFFVTYPARLGSQRVYRIAEYAVDPEDPNRAIPDETIILDIPHEAQIHFGGDLEFGPDGMLYISSGDGAVSSAEDRNAQNLQNLLGKILRINVDSVRPYLIPADNPLAGQFGLLGEIWAWGFRNPFQMSFDRGSGRLFVGDVGELRIEEVDIVTRGGNYGWAEMEGPDCFPETRDDCFDPEFILPIHSYGRTDGAAVVGGRVYRGPQPTRLFGDYIFADFVTRRFWSLHEESQGQWRRSFLGRAQNFLPTTIGEDEAGSLYVTDIVNGRVFRLLFFDLSVLAQVAVGTSSAGPFTTQILLVNNNPREISGELLFFSSDGQPMELRIGEETDSAFPLTLAADSTQTLIPLNDSGDLRFGWAAFAGDGPLQATALFQQFGPDSQVLTQAGVAASRLGRRLIAPARRLAETGLDTGVAIANPWQGETANVTLRVVDGNGQSLASREITLEAFQHQALFLSEIGNLPDDVEARLVIESSRDIAATLLLTVNGQVSASIPVGN